MKKKIRCAKYSLIIQYQTIFIKFAFFEPNEIYVNLFTAFVHPNWVCILIAFTVAGK